MPNKQQQRIAVAAIVIVAAGWWLATSPDSPVHYKPKPDRPVLRLLGRVVQVAAKFGLVALWFCEPQPADADEIQTAKASLGIDGHQILDNARW